MYILLQKRTVEILYISLRNTYKPQHRSAIPWQLTDTSHSKEKYPWKVLIYYCFSNSTSVSLQTTLSSLFSRPQKITQFTLHVGWLLIRVHLSQKKMTNIKNRNLGVQKTVIQESPGRCTLCKSSKTEEQGKSTVPLGYLTLPYVLYGKLCIAYPSSDFKTRHLHCYSKNNIDIK